MIDPTISDEAPLYLQHMNFYKACVKMSNFYWVSDISAPAFSVKYTDPLLLEQT